MLKVCSCQYTIMSQEPPNNECGLLVVKINHATSFFSFIFDYEIMPLGTFLNEHPCKVLPIYNYMIFLHPMFT